MAAALYEGDKGAALQGSMPKARGGPACLHQPHCREPELLRLLLPPPLPCRTMRVWIAAPSPCCPWCPSSEGRGLCWPCTVACLAAAPAICWQVVPARVAAGGLQRGGRALHVAARLQVNLAANM